MKLSVTPSHVPPPPNRRRPSGRLPGTSRRRLGCTHSRREPSPTRDWADVFRCRPPSPQRDADCSRPACPRRRRVAATRPTDRATHWRRPFGRGRRARRLHRVRSARVRRARSLPQGTARAARRASFQEIDRPDRTSRTSRRRPARNARVADGRWKRRPRVRSARSRATAASPPVVRRRIGAWLIEAAKRPGATAVRTPAKPGQVTFRKSPAGPRWWTTSTSLPRPGNGQSRVRRRTGPSGPSSASAVQPKA